MGFGVTLIDAHAAQFSSNVRVAQAKPYMEVEIAASMGASVRVSTPENRLKITSCLPDDQALNTNLQIVSDGVADAQVLKLLDSFDVYSRTVLSPIDVLSRLELQRLELQVDNAGWNPILVIAGTIPEEFAHTIGNPVEHGEKLKWRSPDADFVTGRLQEELGLPDWKGYAQAVKTLKANLSTNPSDGTALERQEAYIRVLYELAEDKHNPQRPLVLAELLDRIGKLKSNQLAFDATGNAQNQGTAKLFDEAVRRLEEELDLKLIYSSNFVFGRENMGITLILNDLGIVVKRPGPEPAHYVDDESNPKVPVIIDDGIVSSPRAQLADRLQHNEVEFAKALGAPEGDKLYVTAGIEIQEDAYTCDLQRSIEEAVAGDRLDMVLTKEVMENLFQIALINEVFERRSCDWSFSGFAFNEADKVYPIDRGNCRPFTERDRAKTFASRLDSIKNIGQSAGDEKTKALIQARVDMLHAEILGEMRNIGWAKPIEDAIKSVDNNGVLARKLLDKVQPAIDSLVS